MLHAAGIGGEADRPGTLDLSTVQAACDAVVAVSACYERLEAQGIGYGAAFRALTELRVGRDQVLARLRLPARSAPTALAYAIHPVLIDAGLQSLAALFVDASGTATHLPAGIDRVSVHAAGPLPTDCWCHAQVRRIGGTLQADLQWYAPDGVLLVDLRGLQLRPANVQRVLHRERSADWLYGCDWRAAPLPAPVRRPTVDELTAAALPLFDAELAAADCQAYLQLLPALEVLAATYARCIVDDLGSTAVPSAAGRALVARLRQLAGHAEAGANWSDAHAGQAALQAQFASARAELTLLRRCAEHTVAVLRGDIDPLSVLFPGGDATDLTRLYETSPGARWMNRLAAAVTAHVVAALPRGARIIEIGAGTGGTTAHVLPRAGDAHYVFTDVAPSLVAAAQQRFGGRPDLRFQRLDIEQSPADQGFAVGGFDLVVAANVLHATADLRQTLDHVRSLLAPGGVLLLLEVTQPLGWLDLIFGLTDGWWRFADRALRPDHPLLSSRQWQDLLRDSGFVAAQALHASTEGPVTLPQSVIVAAAPARSDCPWVLGAADSPLAAALAARAGTSVRPPSTLQRWLADPAATHGAESLQILYVASAVTGSDGIDADPGCDPAELLHVVQTLAAIPHRAWRLCVVTTGGTPAAGTVPRPDAAAVWGLARVVALEHPQLQCRRIDVDSTDTIDGQVDAIARELDAVDAERTVAWRHGQRWVPRLDRVVLPRAGSNGDDGFALGIATRGTPDDLRLQSVERRRPGAGEVEIRVRAAGLNLIDVLDVLDLLPFERDWLGVECAGEIVAVGTGVTGLAVGDAVIALAPGSFRRYVTVDAHWVAPRPAMLDPLDAATIPASFLTARHALAEIAGLEAGERVLIHAAAGGTGLAAVAVARQLGAEVFGTASPAKWPALQARGVARAMHSRTLDFADTVIAAGGVDVVLNSLSGPFIPRSLACLKPGGRFVEIGKRGIWTAEQVRALRPDVHYHRIDLLELARIDPPRIQALLQTVCAGFDTAALRPLPRRVFPIAAAAAAFRCMQRATHIGKIVLDLEPRSATVRSDATYLITGGLGGLGLRTAEWLVAQGARSVVLVARRAESTAAAALAELRATGAMVRVLQADVADGDRMAAVFASLADLPPLKGVFHAAGVLDDGVLQQLDATRLAAVLAPKVDGARHLHRLTRDLPLDGFVLYSSAASLLGSPGQGSHVAANSWLDALAHRRRADGLPALSINWGPWSEIGAAAGPALHASMQARGIGAIPPDHGIRVLADLLERAPRAQVGVIPIRWPEFAATGAGDDPLFADFAGAAVSPGETAVDNIDAPPLLQELMALPARQRHAAVVRRLQGEVAVVLGLPAGRRPEPDLGFFDMGMDSLMTVELRNRLTRQCGVTLTSAVIFEFPTITALAGHLLATMLPEASPASVEPPIAAQPPAAAAIEPATDRALDPAIAAELAALDDLLQRR
ncbi:MAG: SDR family NAD(P)-dependent oxidoreductase [Burkholderiales bacterium]|nr:SDR family NAD(P)-dependent oxidoreductase [Burkholderiales bacterium]